MFGVLSVAFFVAAIVVLPRASVGTLPTQLSLNLEKRTPDDIAQLNYLIFEERHSDPDVVEIHVTAMVSSSIPDQPPLVPMSLQFGSTRDVQLLGCDDGQGKALVLCNKDSFGLDLITPLRPGGFGEFTVRLRGVQGIGFVQDGTEVEAQVPTVNLPVSEYAAAVYAIDEASSYTWQGSRPLTTQSEAQWSWSGSNKQSGGDNATAHGVRHDVQTLNEELTFVAGALVGLAGAALIASVQALYARTQQQHSKLVVLPGGVQRVVQLGPAG